MKNKDPKLEKPPVQGCAGLAVVAMIAFFVIWFFIPSCNDEEEIPAKPLTKEEKRTKEISKCFSAWDGSHIQLRKMIKASMNDPDSYEHIETFYVDQDSTLRVIATFRGKNAYGGVVKQTITAITNTKNCTILKIIE